MDLKQRKLNKSEWDTIELPVSADEIEVLKLIISGFNDVNVKYNKANSIFTYLKIEYNETMEDYLYNKYISTKINAIVDKYKSNFIKITVNPNPNIKKADLIRMQKNNEENLIKNDIYEFILLEQVEQLIKYMKKENIKWQFHYFTLYKLIRNNIQKINRHVLHIINIILKKYEDKINISTIIENSVDYIERNDKLLKYSDMTLYEHQKEIFTHIKQEGPKLVLYIAPTGTGKTLTPIGLSEKYRVIFVCAARHVGLALARAAISVDKKVAFAFGCASADDIRLHYFAAKEYTKNYKSGGIWKVDNSVGDKVEIMICDIKSYLSAMFYMTSFNPVENIVVYWDEPTITLDYQTHDFHSIIHQNWKENIIPNMVLSSATLPKLHELNETIADFKCKFENANIYNIVSHDCKKSIPIINKNGFVVLPHNLSEDYEEILNIVKHCDNYLTLLRYFDLKEVSQFITFVEKNNFITNRLKVEYQFNSLDDINMTSIKIHYLNVLKNIFNGTWGTIYSHFKSIREKRILPNYSIDAKGNKIKKTVSVGPGINYDKSNVFEGKPLSRLASEQITSTPIKTEENVENNGACAIYITTKDAYTLTDGPTIFLSKDVEKIAKFCIQQANIPAKVLSNIMEKIEFNNALNNKIEEIEKELEFLNDKDNKNDDEGSGIKKKTSKDTHKINRTNSETSNSNNDVAKMINQLDALRCMIKTACLNDTFIPNKIAHLSKWAEDVKYTNPFTSNIEEDIIKDIMLLNGVDDSWKVLLMMGIGVFTNHENIKYTEIMKKLADEQKLYMIIASSDYIYGTNYQFCHGYLSKDMDLTQEKIIQAMGRIGRNKIQQDYTIRFRDDEQIIKLFKEDTEKPEVKNMNILFNS